jgi:hypothetical protein
MSYSYAYSVRSEPIDWRSEARIGVLVTAFVTLFGSVVGVVWHALSPQLRIANAIQGSTADMKALIGDDVWLGALGVIAGVICVVLLRLVSNGSADGPGAQIGLAVGGLLGMLVAARVGHLIDHRGFDASLASAVRAIVPNASDQGIRYVNNLFDLRVRAKGVLLAWPMASVLCNVLILGFRPVKQAPQVRLSAYPGSS